MSRFRYPNWRIIEILNKSKCIFSLIEKLNHTNDKVIKPVIGNLLPSQWTECNGKLLLSIINTNIPITEDFAKSLEDERIKIELSKFRRVSGKVDQRILIKIKYTLDKDYFQKFPLK